MNKLILVFFEANNHKLYLLEKDPFNLTLIHDAESIKNSSYPVVGVLSAALVATHICKVPPKQKRYLYKTLPFMLEEGTALEIETQHIASQIQGDHVRAIMIYQHSMESIIQQVAHLGLNLQALYADADLIPIPANSTVDQVLRFNEICLIKTAAGLLAHIDNINQLPDLTDGKIQTPNCSRQNYCATAIAGQVESEQPAINLLQGQFAPQSTMNQRTGRLKKLLVAISLITIIQLLYWGITGSYFDHQAEQLNTQSAQTYLSYFPNDKTIVDIQRQAQGHINRASVINNDDISFIALVAYLGEGIQQIPDAKSLLVKSIIWQRRKAEFVVEIDADNISALEELESKLKQTNQIVVDLNQVNQRNNNSGQGVTGRLTIVADQHKRQGKNL